MQACELIQLATLISGQAHALAGGAGRALPSEVDQYWTASRCRLDRWGRALKEYGDRVLGVDRQRELEAFGSMRGLIEEILVSEVLTRVWAAVLLAHDESQGTHDTEAIGRSVFIGHLEARYRALRLLINGSGIDTRQALELNRLRRRAERAGNLLVARIMPLADVSQFAPDPEQARKMAGELQQDHAGMAHSRWAVLTAALHTSFTELATAPSPNPTLNAQIAGAVMACLPIDLFDDLGLLRDRWLDRLHQTTSDAQGLIDSLFVSPGAGPASEEALHTRNRLQRGPER